MWGVAIYQTASITTKDGEEIPLREAIPNFFNSPAWAEMKESLKQLYRFYQVHGFERLWEEFVEKLDPTGEAHAYKVGPKIQYATCIFYLKIDSRQEKVSAVSWKKMSEMKIFYL